MTLYIRTKYGDQHHVLDTGDIVRLDQPGFKPSGQWKMLGIKHVRRNEVMTLSQVRRAYGPSEVMPEAKPALLFKNGNPQWTMVDLDHGTKRVWGNTKYHGIADIRRID